MTHTDTLGTIVKIDGKKIAGVDLDNLPIPDGDTDEKDTSDMDSGTVKEKGLKMFDPGSATCTGNKVSGDSGQQALTDAYGDRKLHDIDVDVTEAGEIYSYKAYVTKFNPASKDNTYRFASKFLASGKFKLSTTYAGITSLAAGAAGALLIPSTASTALAADANDIVINVTNAITQTTLTVTAAASSYIGYTLDDGETWTSMISGTPSAQIPLGSAGTLKQVRVKVSEALKADRYLNVFIAKAV
jgi:hypothetical protein